MTEQQPSPPIKHSLEYDRPESGRTRVSRVFSWVAAVVFVAWSLASLVPFRIVGDDWILIWLQMNQPLSSLSMSWTSITLVTVINGIAVALVVGALALAISRALRRR